jgi:hypothetical protein
MVVRIDKSLHMPSTVGWPIRFSMHLLINLIPSCMCRCAYVSFGYMSARSIDLQHCQCQRHASTSQSGHMSAVHGSDQSNLYTHAYVPLSIIYLRISFSLRDATQFTPLSFSLKATVAESSFFSPGPNRGPPRRRCRR